MDDSFYKYSRKTKSSVMTVFLRGPSWSTTTPKEVNLAQCQNEGDSGTTFSNFLFQMSHSLSFCKPRAAVNTWLDSYMTKRPYSLKLTKTWPKWSWYLTGRQQVRCSAVKVKEFLWISSSEWKAISLAHRAEPEKWTRICQDLDFSQKQPSNLLKNMKNSVKSREDLAVENERDDSGLKRI